MNLVIALLIIAFACIACGLAWAISCIIYSLCFWIKSFFYPKPNRRI